ncbi:glycosyltransferase family 2 protein [Ichthyobacterium seriolicida]|nr:glycosyltransferase family 2 protein [Ichthyobacterium seriolicida]
MKVSIITVVKNRSNTIEDTISSVLSQDYKDIEYIIIDGNSTDGTMDIINKYRSVISKVVSESDDGIYHAMNKGIDLCTGDIIGILNSDDMLSSKHVISNVVNEFHIQKVDIVYGDLLCVKRHNTNKAVRLWRSKPYNERLFRMGWRCPAHPAFFVKKYMYSTYGKFNTKYRIAADYDLMVRFFVKHRATSYHLPKVLTYMRIGGESGKNIKNKFTSTIESYKAWRDNNLWGNPLLLFLKPLSKLVQKIKFFFFRDRGEY